MELIKRFLKDEEGAIAVEYAVITGGIAIGIILAVDVLRDAIDAWFDDAATSVGTIPDAPPA